MHIPKVRPHTSPQVVKYTLMGVSENSTPKPGVGCLRDAGQKFLCQNQGRRTCLTPCTALGNTDLGRGGHSLHSGRLLITLQYKRTRWYDITLTVPLSIEGHYLPMIPIWFTHKQPDPLIASFINLLATANTVTNIRAGN